VFWIVGPEEGVISKDGLWAKAKAAEKRITINNINVIFLALEIMDDIVFLT